ncbi:MAG: SMI1/KNR4 family protein [Cytophagales bacterium]|nr:MAG: SMI1/KNR4 family protein [Cytophagales bacterium]TAF61720.1 MAG: SMI1/KNR4 family protein [Cytophagales bacterium]
MKYKKKLEELFIKKSTLNIEGQETISFGNEKANSNEIEDVGNDFIALIPNDYIEFWKNWNGCTLFDLKQQAGFNFFSTKEVEIETYGFKEIYGMDWDKSIILFCSVIGSGDFIGFQKKSEGYTILDCCHEDLPQNWKEISHSFGDFMNQLIDNRGKCFWLD